MKVWTLSKLGLPYVPSTLVGVATFVQGTGAQGDHNVPWTKYQHPLVWTKTILDIVYPS